MPPPPDLDTHTALTLNRPHLGTLTPEASRPGSPYAPPVNYDGLSWPSESPGLAGWPLLMLFVR